MNHCALLLPFAALICVPSIAETVLLHSFEDPDCATSLRANNTRIGLVSDHATEGEKALKIDFRVTDWPNVFFAAPGAYELTDWRGHGAFMFDAYNPGDTPLRINVRIDDSPEANGAVHCRQVGVDLPPGKPVTVALAIQTGDIGMRGGPPSKLGDVNGDLGSRELDLGNIIAFQFFLARPTKEATVYIDNVRLNKGSSLEGIVDRFGQYVGADWPGKVYDEEDLADRREEETRALADAPLPPDRDRWGGWADGPKLDATGWFRVEQVDGKWWLVTPDGTLFWSLGLDCVRPDNNGPIKDREFMFTWLPEKGDPLYAFGGRDKGWANFYGMNLYRKYGPDWLEPWLDMTRKRMLAWGFNTVANWSDNRAYASLRLPFTVPIHYGANRQFPGGWKDIPDVYADQWAEAVAEAIQEAAELWAQDPYCIGYFVDNELSWGAWGETGQLQLAINALALKGDWMVKQRFTALLREKYETIGALNAAWKMEIASWEKFEAEPVEIKLPVTDALKQDMAVLLRDFATRYFTVIRDLMKKHMPNQLYLGPRFAISPDDVVMVAKDYCDVVSYNIYGRAPSIISRSKQIERLGKPVVIGEFHFGALDRGMFHTGLGPVGSQEERGEQYSEYIRTALEQPWCVGAHWFIYADQALTGRFDGENYNIGMVSVTDTPYPELTGAATQINHAAYKIRSGRDE
ncbi:MAG: beta-galactosidase [Acidobacteriota bacterium]|nr:beta-galactosidase [Acidobacteriota bacterium]